ncbi:MAG: helix-turn-helix transcriptional regulator [Atopobiaceae bacterium]
MSEDFIELSGNDTEAERLLSIALEFENASAPLSSDYVRRNFYANIQSDESARKAFMRDRQKLVLCGVVISLVSKEGTNSGWAINTEATFANPCALGAKEALTIDLACAPLASDPSFPYASDLRQALAKIDRTFDAQTPVRLTKVDSSRPSTLPTLEQAASQHTGVQVTYQKADGSTVRRTLGVLGFYPLRGNTYVVATNLDKGCIDPHVYNSSRIRAAKIQKTTTYEVPDDFDIRDYIRLPFQLGPRRYTARFSVPSDDQWSLRVTSRGQGTFSTTKDFGLVWDVDVSSTSDAASWAISQGIRPVLPQELVADYRSLLEGTLRNAE